MPSSVPARPGVVIPVCDDLRGTARLVRALLAGSLVPARIVCVDSSAAPDLYRLLVTVIAPEARKAGSDFTVIRLEPGRFNHGWTRNLGIALCGAELVALFSQDALPEKDCLSALVRRIMADERLAGVFARQMPFDSTPEPVRRRVDAHYPANPDAADPLRAAGVVRFDSVAGIIRLKAWLDRPFPLVEIAEDIEWARILSGRGWKFAYEPSAAVFHAHDLDGRADFERGVRLHRLLSRVYGLRTVPSLAGALKGVATLVRQREHRFPEAVGEVFGQYVGGLIGGLERTAGRHYATYIEEVPEAGA
ncbi:MAG: glycosyltransferase [Deltaproteobacteria bacterium]|nr:glycosyltransferase [Deltaproteobacteria bacterium]